MKWLARLTGTGDLKKQSKLLLLKAHIEWEQSTYFPFKDPSIQEPLLKLFPFDQTPTLHFKISADGAVTASRSHVLVGLVLLNTNMSPHSHFNVLPITLWEGKEDSNKIDQVFERLTPAIRDLSENGLQIKNERVKIQFWLGGDLKILWTISKRKFFPIRNKNPTQETL